MEVRKLSVDGADLTLRQDAPERLLTKTSWGSVSTQASGAESIQVTLRMTNGRAYALNVPKASALSELVKLATSSSAMAGIGRLLRLGGQVLDTDSPSEGVNNLTRAYTPSPALAEVASRFPFFDYPHPIAMAHRGGDDGVVAENTTRAFSRAHGMGFRYFESDLRVTCDGVVYLFHDELCKRLARVNKTFESLSHREVEELQVIPDERVPTFAEVLQLWPDARMNIDLKGSESGAAGARVVLEHEALDRVCIGSTSAKGLASFQKLVGKRVPVSISPIDALRLEASRWRMRMNIRGGDCVQVPYQMATAGLVNRLHERGYPVIVWVVNETDDMEHLLDIGVDGIMTGAIGELVRVYRQRNIWPLNAAEVAPIAVEVR